MTKATKTRAVVTGFLTADLITLMALVDYLYRSAVAECATALYHYLLAFLKTRKNLVLAIEMPAEGYLFLHGDTVFHNETLRWPEP